MVFSSLPSNASLDSPLTVNAVGACTALAPTLVQTAFLIRRGSFAVRESALLTPEGAAFSACALPTLDPFLYGSERILSLARAALRDLPLSLEQLMGGLRLKVYPLLSRQYEGQLPNGRQRGDEMGFALKAEVDRTFHDSAVTQVTSRDATALGELLPQIGRDLQHGVADVAIVIAAHSDLDAQHVKTLFDSDRLFTDDNDDGLLLGEAAALVVLSTAQITRQHRLPEVARIHAVHLAYDRATPDNDASAFEALGLTFATRRVLEAAPVTRGKVGWLFSDLNFEHYRVSEYQAVLARCQDVFAAPQVHEYPAQRLGNLGCATAPIHVALAATAWTYGFAPDSYCLSWSGHDDGTRCGLVVSR